MHKATNKQNTGVPIKIKFVSISEKQMKNKLTDLLFSPSLRPNFWDSRFPAREAILGKLDSFCLKLIESTFPDLDKSWKKENIAAHLRTAALGGPGCKFKPRMESDYSPFDDQGKLELYLKKEDILRIQPNSSIIDSAVGKLISTLHDLNRKLQDIASEPQPSPSPSKGP
jgi:hypothetical protein